MSTTARSRGSNVWTGQPNGPTQHLAERLLPDGRRYPERASGRCCRKWGCLGATLSSLDSAAARPVARAGSSRASRSCLDSAGHLCSANSNPGQHRSPVLQLPLAGRSERNRGHVRGPAVDGAMGTRRSGATSPTRRPHPTRRPSNPCVRSRAKLASPLSQAKIAAIVDPEPERVVRGRWHGDRRQRLARAASAGTP